MIDVHVHLTALPDGKNGCFISPAMLNGVLFRFLLKSLGLPVDDPIRLRVALDEGVTVIAAHGASFGLAFTPQLGSQKGVKDSLPGPDPSRGSLGHDGGGDDH